MDLRDTIDGEKGKSSHGEKTKRCQQLFSQTRAHGRELSFSIPVAGQAVTILDGYISDSLFLFGTLDFLHIERLTVAKLENRRVLVIECSF